MLFAKQVVPPKGPWNVKSVENAWHTLSVEEALSLLESNETGLTHEEVRRLE